MKTQRWTAAALLAATVLLHVAALIALLNMLAPRRDKDTPSAAIDVVWVKTPPPAPAPVVQSAPPVARSRPAPRRVRALAAVTARADDPQSAAPITLAGETAPAGAEPAFDRHAALAAARKLASEKDPARAGTLSAALEARRELEETEDEKMGRTIASGKRKDCIGPNAGGSLLTPLMWLIQKKGSGCKF